MFNHSKEIILSSNRTLYAYPEISDNHLMVINSGSSMSILRQWKVSRRDIWLRVELATNKFIEHPNKITRGWIKI